MANPAAARVTGALNNLTARSTLCTPLVLSSSSTKYSPLPQRPVATTTTTNCTTSTRPLSTTTLHSTTITSPIRSPGSTLTNQSLSSGTRHVSSPAGFLSSSSALSSSSSSSLPSNMQVRHSSHSPLGTPAPSRKKVTINTLNSLYRKKEPITMITAHDFPSAHVADHAGMDMVLVGDSLAMVALGMEDTSEVLLEEMILHMRSVARATKAAFTVGDLPMGTYEISPSQALETAIRVIKEGRMQAIKLEGGLDMAPTIQRITSAGIPVLAHVGLTPQRQNSLGGFRVQGKTTVGALQVLRDALAVQQAGAFAVVLEAVPEGVARLVTEKLSIPTIGIGAGSATSGQVLVQVDMAGNFPPGRFLPKFVKQYGNVWAESMRAIESYRREVKERSYPAPEHTYPMPDQELAEFERILREQEQTLVEEEAHRADAAAAAITPTAAPAIATAAGSAFYPAVGNAYQAQPAQMRL